MKVHHTLICFFFFMLQDGLLKKNKSIPSYKGKERQNITVQCNFTTTGNRKYFCKDKCKAKLLEMDGDSDQSGRYRMRYETIPKGSHLNVTITHLRKSDSGRYGCGLGKRPSKDRYQQFKIIVTNASATITTTTTTTTSPKTTNQSEQEQTEKTTAGSSGVLLYVGLTLVLIVLLSSVVVLILCKKRASKPKERPEETECDNVTEDSRVYEEIREGDGPSRSPPVENSVEASDDYSVVTATAPRLLSKTEDDLNELNHTEVDFSNRAATSLSSAPSGQIDNVIYSAPQTHTDATIASQPLYSTVTLPQQ